MHARICPGGPEGGGGRGSVIEDGMGWQLGTYQHTYKEGGPPLAA